MDQVITRNVTEEIQQQLAQIEKDRNVRILFAIESGSRAWGFESSDSDYDVRFVYSPNLAHYFRINDQHRDMALPENRDVIEMPIVDDLDVNGWDVRKMLGLIYKSNPTIFEWLNSPIVYQNDNDWIAEAREITNKFYSPTRAHYHYFSMAQKNLRDYLQGDMVRYKKYLYVVRPLLCVQWIEAGKGIPPVNFMELVNGIVTDPVLRKEIDDLLEVKMRGGEAELQPTRPVLNQFIQSMLARFEKPTYDDTPQPDITELDKFLYSTAARYQL